MPRQRPAASNEEILREVLDVVTQLRNGHFSAHMDESHAGVGGEIARVLNQHLKFLQRYRNEHSRLMEEVGITGRLGGQMEPPHGTGAWRQMAEATNTMLVNLTATFRQDAKAVAALVIGRHDARVASSGIQGEFRAFRQNVETLIERRNGSARR
jgi:hypothetical protein